MFPLQSDGLVLEQDKILDVLLADCAALEGNNKISNDKGVKKRQREASSGPGGAQENKSDEDNDRKTRKSLHRDIERQRRQEMSGLYASLRSLLPLEYIKGKRAVTDQLHQAAKYINHMQEKIEKMQTRREKLKKKFAGDAEELNKSKIFDSCNYVNVSLCRDGMEILIGIRARNNKENLALSKVFAELVGRYELNVSSCVSTAASDEWFLHKIQIEVNDSTSIVLPELQKRLVNMIN